MKTVCIDGAELKSMEDVHRSFAEALGFPAYYGKNLDALHDCLTDLGEETVISLENTPALTEALGEKYETLLRVLRDAAAENPVIRLDPPEGTPTEIRRSMNMATVSLKCPQCGAQIELNGEKESGFCTFCGSPVNIREALAAQAAAPADATAPAAAETEVCGPSNSEQYERYMELASGAYADGQLRQAYENYTLAAECAPRSYLPRFRKALCAAALSTAEEPRLDEVVQGMDDAFQLVFDPSDRQSMLSEIAALTVDSKIPGPDKSGTFKSMQECSAFLAQTNHRLALMDKLYSHVVTGETDTTVSYVTEILRCCRILHTSALKYKGEDGKKTVKYAIPSDIRSRVRSLRRKYRSEHAKLTAPKTAQLGQEISQVKAQIKSLPGWVRFLHIILSWPFLLLALVCAAGYFWKKFMLYIGAGILLILIICFIVYKAKKVGREGGRLYKELKAKKTELKLLKAERR